MRRVGRGGLQYPADPSGCSAGRPPALWPAGTSAQTCLACPRRKIGRGFLVLFEPKNMPLRGRCQRMLNRSPICSRWFLSVLPWDYLSYALRCFRRRTPHASATAMLGIAGASSWSGTEDWYYFVESSSILASQSWHARAARTCMQRLPQPGSARRTPLALVDRALPVRPAHRL